MRKENFTARFTIHLKDYNIFFRPSLCYVAKQRRCDRMPPAARKPSTVRMQLVRELFYKLSGNAVLQYLKKC
jgi:hypothetical protein